MVQTGLEQSDSPLKGATSNPPMAVGHAERWSDFPEFSERPAATCVAASAIPEGLIPFPGLRRSVHIKGVDVPVWRHRPQSLCLRCRRWKNRRLVRRDTDRENEAAMFASR